MKFAVTLLFALTFSSISAQTMSSDYRRECLNRVLDLGDTQELLGKLVRGAVIGNIKHHFKGKVTNVRILKLDFSRFKFDDTLELWQASQVNLEGYITKKGGGEVPFISNVRSPKFFVNFVRSVFGEIEGCSVKVMNFSNWVVVNSDFNQMILAISDEDENLEMSIKL